MARFRASSLTILLVGVCQCKGRRINQNPRRELRNLGSAREDDIGTDIFVNNHPNPVTPRSSFFEAKYCSPDENGYYGSTNGTPSALIFGFGVETVPSTDMSDVFPVIHESVENVLLSVFFPTLCLNREPSRRLDVHGFWFGPANQYVGSCTPIIDGANPCAMYAGTVRVYGEGKDVLAVIRDYLDLDSTAGIHPSLERIFSVKLSDDMVVESGQANVDTLSSVTAGISVAVVTLSIVIVVVGAAVFHRRHHTRHSQSSAGCHESGISSAIDSDLALDADYADRQEVSHTEEVDMQLGSSLVLEDGRPTYSTHANELL